jgi:hypothetical protein
MERLVEKLDLKLREWTPETANDVRTRVSEIIEMADRGTLDVCRSRAVEKMSLT